MGLTWGKFSPEKLSKILLLASNADNESDAAVFTVHSFDTGPEEKYEGLKKSVEADKVYLEELMKAWTEIGYRDKKLFLRVRKTLKNIEKLKRFDSEDITTKIREIVDVFDYIDDYRQELVAFLIKNK
uniref:Uncharacterized protein n=1 Tax=Clastoptera arizonana TaxID=38151 RepID=A0A1B6CQI2_9HEMI